MIDVKKFTGDPIAGFSSVKGNYWCTCRDCGVVYYGDKRSWLCRPCAVLSVDRKIEYDFGSGI